MTPLDRLVKILHDQGLSQIALVLDWFVKTATSNQCVGLETALMRWSQNESDRQYLERVKDEHQ